MKPHAVLERNPGQFVALSSWLSRDQIVSAIPISAVIKALDKNGIQIVKRNPHIDLSKLEDLGNHVYPGGGRELLEKVRQVRAGEKIVL